MQLLERLSLGLMNVALLIREGNDPLLYRERQDYLAALFRAVGDLEMARVKLAAALQRLEDGEGAPG